MLTGEQVLSLIEAGFTADEIRQYNTGTETGTSAETDTGTETGTNAETDTGTETGTSTDTSTGTEQEQEQFVGREEFDSLKESIAQLTKTIQANNILHASKDTGAKTLTVDEAADAAIKAFFNA